MHSYCACVALMATARCHLNMLRRAASKSVRRGSARSIAPRATPGLVHRELLPVYAAPRQTAAVWGLLWAQARNRWARILAECLLIHLVVCVPSQLLYDSHKPEQDTPKRAKVAPPFPPRAWVFPLPSPVFVDFHESHDCIAADHRELLPVQQTGSYSRSVKTCP